MFRHTKRFARDEEGAILVIVAMSLGIILGMIALSFDLGRIAATQSEMQSYADHVALAAAGELDGEAGAITRATNAAAAFFTDRQSFAAGTNALTSADYTLTFLRSLPSLDTTAITSTNDAAGDADAIYARVVIRPRNVPFTFGRAFLALTGGTQLTANATAEAVAGFTSFACDITPMMFCLPPGFTGDGWRGRQILMRSGGNNAAWGPGDFGFLEPSTLAIDSTGACAGANGTAETLRCVLGAVGSITQCFQQRGVDTEPGQKVGITNAMNARFDIYQGAIQQLSSNVLYAPAPNVIKGLVRQGGGGNGGGNGGGGNGGGGNGGGGNGNQCIGNNADPSPDTIRMPRDSCFHDGSCTQAAPNRYGDGGWYGAVDSNGDGTADTGYATYLSTNYGGSVPSEITALGATPTRYELYLAEIAFATRTAGNILSGRAETGLPVCAPTATPDPERRVIIAAGINCEANPINGRATGVPVQEYVKMFITEAIGDDGVTPPTVDIWAEVIETVSGNGRSGAGVFHEIVQLYR